MQKKNLHAGHRQRMKQKFLNHGLDGFSDHEVIELALYYCIPQKDTNIRAHELLEEYGSIANLFDAEYASLRKSHLTENAATYFKLVQALGARIEMDRAKARKVLNSSDTVGNYARHLFIGQKAEVFYLLCLDGRCRLIQAVCLQEGTVDKVAIYTRTVVESALKFHAKNVIIVHNHPSGSLRPSLKDIETTETILEALRPIGINLLDHVIIADSGYYSFVRNNQMSREFDGNIAYIADVEE